MELRSQRICFLWLYLFLLSVLALDNPYHTLGVKQTASIPEIKRAYKNLAREWHPDKNKDPSAEAKFIEINKAYELLMDPERRQEFDRFGRTEDTPNFRKRPDYTSFRRFDHEPFETFFGPGGFRFQFNFNQGSVYHKYTITTRAYENNLVPGSSVQPYMILFYGDLCFPCIQAEPVWERIVAELEPLGMGFAAVHAQHENALARKIGVSSLPYIIGVINGHAIHYKEDQLSLLQAIEFGRRLFPYKTIIKVDDSSVESFLTGWADNRVRVLIFSRIETIRLRYLLVAHQYHARAAFGFISLNSLSTHNTVREYGVNPKMESLLVFNENYHNPIAVLSMTELPPQMMRDILESNKYLLLPRLSSQELFDHLCPSEGARTRRKLCVILITQNTEDHEPHREVMRNFVQQFSFSKERVRFMYLYQDKQTEFVKALSSGKGGPEDPTLHVVILWRREHDRVWYQWLDSEWTANEKKVNASKQELRATLNHLIQSTSGLQYDAKVTALVDEHARGLFSRIIDRLILMADVLRDNLTRQEILPAVSVILSVGFIVLVGYIMSYLVKLEEQSIREKYEREGKQPPGLNPKPNFFKWLLSNQDLLDRPDVKLHIHELRGETYNGLIRLLKPGCRTIVLLCDAESKPKLYPKFFQTVYPYRRNKTLMFAFLMVEKNLDWYRRLLLQTLGEPRELNINPKNCIGTVLSLNGHRKYFCVYHAKHMEPGPSRRRRRNKKNENSGNNFMGFEDSSESETSDIEAGKLIKDEEDELCDEYSNILFQEHLLDGLPNWLDRLFEGSTKRYYIQYWPENMK